ncbi:MAG TPA: OsmC family protein [Candidatus Lokiarchaeia archaeon]|nr:OsmC family protein [Candidatus Lokiarchaeia archaeon]
MPVRTSTAIWSGGIRDGHGRVSTKSGVLMGNEYSFGSRFSNDEGTNPEELLGAAHAGCFSMALSAALEQAGFKVTSITTKDRVNIEQQGDGFRITKIEIETVGIVEGIDEDTFRDFAEDAKDNCPVSKALAGVGFELVTRCLQCEEVKEEAMVA